jgi:hypothetical protein
MNFREFHHLYLGIFISALGCILHSLVIVGIGIIISVDDWIQHFFKIEGKTPLHIIYGWVYKKSGLIQRINKYFDRLFGRK